MSPPACNMAGYAQTVPRGNPRAGRFVVPETLNKLGTEAARRGWSGSCSSSWDGQKVSPRKLQIIEVERGNSSACSSLFWLHKSSGLLSAHLVIRSGEVCLYAPKRLPCGGSSQKVCFAIFMVPPWTLLPWEKLRKSSIWSTRKLEGQTTADKTRMKVGWRCYPVHIQEKMMLYLFSASFSTGVIKLLNHTSVFSSASRKKTDRPNFYKQLE